MTIVEYNSTNDIVIEFEDGYRRKDSYGNFKKGLVKNPFDKTIYGVGYIGSHDYYKFNNISKDYSYVVWSDMITRCYSEKSQINSPTYKDCTVDEKWHSYNNFKEWYDMNYYTVNGEKTSLDKDLIKKGNKVYSDETCIFVPKTINQIFQTHAIRKDETMPTGVSKHGKSKFMASVCDNINKNRIYSKPFNTREEARDEYIRIKRDYIRRIAEYYKIQIPERLYKILIHKSEVYGNGERE